jgi:hypothetical protein
VQELVQLPGPQQVEKETDSAELSREDSLEASLVEQVVGSAVERVARATL